MSLSQSVEESLNEAEASLRNALSFAARQERPMICATISNLIQSIEAMKKMDTFMDTLDSLKKPGDGTDIFRTFF